MYASYVDFLLMKIFGGQRNPVFNLKLVSDN